jgi:trigger factor
VSVATVKHLDPTQVELEIEIANDELDRARERAFRELVRNVRIPGFRPGKAPRKIFEAQYGSSQIEERALNAVVPQMYSRALQENDLDPLDQPQMELLPEEEGQPLRVRATVSVRPHIALHDYKGLALQAPPVAVSDADVQGAIEELRTNAATLVPVDRPVQIGDVPTLDYAGTLDGEPFAGGSAESQPTTIAEDRFIPGFAAGIIGMAPGETKEIEARFPDDYANATLAGRTAVFRVTVLENKIAERPELDDEFAKRFGDSDATVASLRDAMRNQLEASAHNRERRELTQQLLERLLAAHQFAVPAVLVDRESENLRSEARNYVERAGLRWPDYLERQGKSDDTILADSREEAERRVKTSLLLEAIAKAENVTATSADIEAEVRQLSEQHRQPREAILEMLRSNFNALVDGIVRTKTVDFLIEKAHVTPQAGSPDSAEEAAPAEEDSGPAEATRTLPA